MMDARPIATLIRRRSGENVQQWLFRLSEPVRAGWPPLDDDDEDTRPLTDHCVVSISSRLGPLETKAFPSDENGNVISFADWLGYDYEYQGVREILERAGYKVEMPEG